MVGADSLTRSVQANETATANVVLQPQARAALVVTGTNDLFGEIRGATGTIPVADTELLDARNAFDPPIGLLTSIKSPSGHRVTRGEGKGARGRVNATCSGPRAQVDVAPQGLLSAGT